MVTLNMWSCEKLSSSVYVHLNIWPQLYIFGAPQIPTIFEGQACPCIVRQQGGTGSTQPRMPTAMGVAPVAVILTWFLKRSPVANPPRRLSRFPHDTCLWKEALHESLVPEGHFFNSVIKILCSL